MHDRDELIEGMAIGSAVMPGQLTYFDDLNSVRMFLFNSLLGPKSYIAQRQKTTFERPTFLIQSLSQALVPHSGYHAEIDHNMLVEFHSLDYLTGMAVAGDLQLLIAGADGRTGMIDPRRKSGGLVLPYWDLTDIDNPVIQADEWWSENSNFPPGSVPRMGCRVVQETAVVNCEQEDPEVAESQFWTVSMTFRMLAPRVLYDYTLETPLTAVKLTGVFSA